ncbi:hypothetical protein SAMN04487936_102170 [Halobacillus dabanensis]|uniref:Uncharacterized protein n=1 Tax=Halobacillus dabanensis TaxID=240302 RepID=A0A1I3RAT9_HALDA|nr:hypothetical protein [Halobacillus dabanensis]SFJ43774.1 hypothetical protein SAMN04487936_102170 [Halobacillus dabanensis]
MGFNKNPTSKGKEKIEEQQVIYDEIINSLLQDKMDLEAIAREYKSLYESVTISDKDIEYLQSTVQQVVELLSSTSPKVSAQQESFNVLINLINKDTLKTMQLLGFNYKEAIGIPLTEVCANAIHTKIGGNNKTSNQRKKK